MATESANPTFPIDRLDRRASARRGMARVCACALLLVGACSAQDAGDGAYSAYYGAPMHYPPASAAEEGSPADSESETAAPRSVNPFVIASHDPFSTFAADVDTASYDLFRRDVSAGYLPDAQSVRLEEYVNYFRYDYPRPSAEQEHPFTIDLEAAPNPLGRDTLLLRVGVQAVDLIPDDQSDGPANIVFLADVSGSMQSEEKLPLVKRVMRSTLDLLDEDDRVSIVTYASGTGVLLPSTPVESRHVIDLAIAGLSAGGGTNGAGGLNLAYEQAMAGMVDGINHVVLMTDGDFNVGPSSTPELVSLIEEKRRSGITLTALGFGRDNLNDNMMELVTNAGNGIYGVITDDEQADNYVHERMLSTLVHSARDMKLQVEFNPEFVHAYRLLGYENRDIADEDFRVDAVDAGDVGSGHQVTALYELVMAGGELPDVPGAPIDDGEPVDGAREVDASDFVLVKVRYKDPADPEPAVAFETSSGLPTAAIESELSKASGDTQWAVAVAGIAEMLSGSPYGDRAQFETIRAILDARAGEDPDRRELQSLLPGLSSLL